MNLRISLFLLLSLSYFAIRPLTQYSIPGRNALMRTRCDGSPKRKKVRPLGQLSRPPECDWFITILVFLGRMAGGTPLWHFASFLAIFKQFNLILLVLAKLKQLGHKKKKKKLSPTVFRLCSRNLLSVCIEVIKSANSYYTQSEKQVTYLYIL